MQNIYSVLKRCASLSNHWLIKREMYKNEKHLISLINKTLIINVCKLLHKHFDYIENHSVQQNEENVANVEGGDVCRGRTT